MAGKAGTGCYVYDGVLVGALFPFGPRHANLEAALRRSPGLRCGRCLSQSKATISSVCSPGIDK